MLLGSSVRYVLDEGDYRENSQEAVAVIQAKKKKKKINRRQNPGSWKCGETDAKVIREV